MSASVAVVGDEAHGFEATRRRLSPRQAEVVVQLVRATEEEVDAVGYEIGRASCRGRVLI